ncbi:MAG: hypothetical protein V4514_07500 [Pseudomonadota bacterium]|uniref:hypothetical protein n=1 Tax=Phenylobacterium sp. TaxID=1871053 RepID=UPI0025DF9FDC|nr:hypothetical protein [Phenylobacterium sp.]MBT9471648.1 hypothetical protein [Phenylobacterium sp.]
MAKLTAAERRRALGYGLIGIGFPVAGPALAMFYLWLPRRSLRPHFDIPPSLIGWLWATLFLGLALVSLGAYLCRSAKRA